MTDAKKARAVGFNHVALEVGDIEEALTFYGRLLDFELRSKSETMAFVDLGDQFLALAKGRRQAPDDERHVGLVVDDKEAVRLALLGATGSRSSATRTSSSPRRRTSYAAWGWRASASLPPPSGN